MGRHGGADALAIRMVLFGNRLTHIRQENILPS